MPTRKSHGNLRLLWQQSIPLLRLIVTMLRHACLSIGSSVTTRFFAMLLGQQKISARFSNHPHQNPLAFGEGTGVQSVCTGVILRFDGYATSE